MSFALLAHGATGDEVDQFTEHHLVARRAIIILGEDAFRPGFASIAGIASSISLPMLGCLALP
jgi:hypothetical protein